MLRFSVEIRLIHLSCNSLYIASRDKPIKIHFYLNWNNHNNNNNRRCEIAHRRLWVALRLTTTCSHFSTDEGIHSLRVGFILALADSNVSELHRQVINRWFMETYFTISNYCVEHCCSWSVRWEFWYCNRNLNENDQYYTIQKSLHMRAGNNNYCTGIVALRLRITWRVQWKVHWIRL